MRALVVYESMFGNTQVIAQAIADGWGTAAEVDLREVGTQPALDPDVDVLVVGGPTHAFGMTRASTRNTAREQAAKEHLNSGHVVSEQIGIREWLDALPRADSHRLAAAFDTRVAPARVPGSAAKGIAKRLRTKGFAAACPPRTFWVTGTPGPLVDGEVEAARQWGQDLRAFADRQAMGQSRSA